MAEKLLKSYDIKKGFWSDKCCFEFVIRFLSEDIEKENYKKNAGVAPTRDKSGTS